MPKNYYQSIEESNWPKRLIRSIEEIPNTFDNRGMALRATLECGHECVLTGEAVQERSFIHCKRCMEIH